MVGCRPIGTWSGGQPTDYLSPSKVIPSVALGESYGRAKAAMEVALLLATLSG
jgi:hypothetical protein